MKPERHKSIPAAYLILQGNGKTLLLKRQNTGFCDGLFGLPSGHIESGESIVEGMIREAKEEIGIDLLSKNLLLAHVRDRNAEDGHRIDFFFLCSRWEGEIENREPRKCAELMWIEGTDHPDIIPYVKEVLDHVAQQHNYSLEDWL